jgi:hypothetical protein
MRAAATNILCAGFCLVLAGCAGAKEWEPDNKPEVYSVSHRPYAPQPVYSRLRWVHPPTVLPARTIAKTGAPAIVKTYSLSLKNATIEDAAAALAAAARYSSFCSSSVASQKISIEGMGTIDELAASIAAKGKVQVVVDHEGREIRILRKEDAAPQPKFTE